MLHTYIDSNLGFRNFLAETMVLPPTINIRKKFVPQSGYLLMHDNGLKVRASDEKFCRSYNFTYLENIRQYCMAC